MSFNFRDYLKVAVYLHQNLPGEASIRSAISRAYYSVFSAAKNFCLSEKIITTNEARGSKCHTNVIDGLVSHDDRTIKAVGKKLETLREKRNYADYDSFNKDMNVRTLNWVLDVTNDMFSKLDELKN